MPTSPPVAIVGMSSLFAGSQDLLGFWRDIVSATDRLTDVPPHAWLIEDYYDPDPSAPDMTYAKRGGYLDPVAFNPMEFGLPPTTIPATDTAQLLALIAAKRVLEDAGRFSDEADHGRTSVVLGVASATELVVEMGSRLQHPIWRKALRDAGLPESRVQEIVQRIKDHYQPWQESTFPGLLGNVVAGRIANRLNLGGSNYVTDAACASSISALQAGLHELYLGDSDMVIAGGVDALNDILMYMCFSKTPAFSPTGDCRPFSDEADGTLIGEGVGMLALRRLEDAERDGDKIYAVIRGVGASSDGKGSSVYAPRPEGQAKALRRAYEKADFSPATVELVEAHGTATKAGDAAEVRGLTSVFAPANEDGERWCALGSVKSQIGHTKAAAGSAGLIKVALALHHKILPPTLKVAKPNAKLGLDDGPLYINTEARPWIRASDHPRRGSVSSFGFGGSNFHVALEEYTGPGNRPERLRAWSQELILLSAGSADELASELDGLRAEIEAGQPLSLLAHDFATTFEAGAPARVALVAGSLEELDEKAQRAGEAISAGVTGALPDPDIALGFGVPERGKLAFVFPGQGSQYVGMGAHAAMMFDDARAVWDAAADMEEFRDERLDRAVFPPPAFTDEERAHQNRRVTAMATAQPAIAAVSLGYLHLLRRLGVEPDAVAGHSFGELSALAAAGRIDEVELLATARKRGELMAEAAEHRAGAMIALPAGAERVAELIDDSDDVVIANDNAPTEVAVAGSVEAIQAFAEKAKAAGLRSVRLPVASAFHSSIVADSCEPFHEHLSSVSWGKGSIEVYANTTAAPYPKTGKAARRLLADQLASPVRFREMIEAMHAAGVTHFVEVGPGGVLTKLIGRCLGDRTHVAVSLDDKKTPGLRAFWRGLGRLAAAGVQIDLNALAEGYRLPDAPSETRPFEIMITGFNHDRPYPPEEGAAGLPSANPEVAPTSSPSPEAHTPDTPVVSAFAASSASTAGVRPTSPSRPAAPASASMSAAAPGAGMPSIAAPPTDAAAAAQVHQATIEAHRRYQELMAESHRAFLDMAGEALRQAQGVASVAPRAQAFEQVAPLAVHASPAPEWPTPTRPDEASPAATPEASPEAILEVSLVEATAGAAAAKVDVAAMALEVVSEKTGYPVEMLDLDMEMEAGLGIDSIKQVEILSELQERLPGLPEIAPSELASLRTLRDVAEKLDVAGPTLVSLGGAATVANAERLVEAAEPASPSGAADPSAPPSMDVSALALEVVSEKTGYPVEMLDLDMEMEAGLGIDSIKQVEILSELQERLPGLPEIAPSELASLRTLRDVAEKLTVGGVVAASVAAGPPVVAVAPEAAPAPADPEASGVSEAEITALALTVVSEKTGYPVEMLDLDMEMEAGLGIDSIKQVEILSELQERLPELPEIAPSELASLRTLRDVADKLSSGRVEVAGVAPASTERADPVATENVPHAASVGSASQEDVTALALQVVAEKTGYPVEMLDLDMEMEAGLGIDSIKQVEILSELQERLPELPEIAPSELASLRTLRDVAERLSVGVAPAPAGPTAQPGRAVGRPDAVGRADAVDRPDTVGRPDEAVVLDPTAVSAFVPIIVPELRPGFGLSALTPEAVIEVTNEVPSLASALAEGLAAHGISARVVDAPSAQASGVICLAGLGAETSGPDASLAVHSTAIQAARLVAQHPDPSERLFVTVQSTGGHFGLAGDPGDGAWTAGLAGIVKTAAREWPGASLKAIDVADPETAGDAILDELFLGGPALEVGISADGVRSVVQIEPLAAAQQTKVPLDEGSVVVVSGGARGVTASSVAELAASWGVRLALLGRSALQDWPEGVPLTTDSTQITGALAKIANDRGETVDFAGLQDESKKLAASAEVRMTLAELDANGVDAMYLSADVTNADEVGAALDHVRQTWGSIDGIVHGAGVLRDKAIADMTPDRVAEVFAPKVTGLSVLLEATKEDPIQVIALFSSIAARAGNAGQAAYAAANEVLNKVASAEAHQRGEWCRVRSYNWGPWAGGMVDEGLAAHFEKQGIALLDVGVGSRFFVAELAMTGSGVERVVLAAPSFPAVMQSFTVSHDDDEDGPDARGFGLASGLVADFALRLGQALKPVRTMRMYLEDFVSAMRDSEGPDATGPHTVEVHPIVAAIPGYRLIFKDRAGNAHHETMVRYADNGSSPPPQVPSGGLEPWPFEAAAAYETVFGSGTTVRSIETLEGVSEEGGMALLRSAHSVGWPPTLARGFDPAAFEGLIQLGELWAHHKAGAIQKLARMGSMVVHHLEAIPERLRSAFRARRTEKGTLFDFILATEEGDLVAELREVQFDAPVA
ncbi:MAG: SDR family NAD(P)-dependent oxidoreductase [Gemmatimonadota bacterium]|nr:SDR family NAD(P)-dependent oxidoreductase [Gemmatimonadota bacterium]